MSEWALDPEPLRDDPKSEMQVIQENYQKLATKLHRVRGFVTSYKASHIGLMTPVQVKDEICDAVLDIIENAGE